ncbi:MAG: serine hydrolase [Chloroflexi bacterium]|nr:serine hydrolase [Chloroflexota bacterium]
MNARFSKCLVSVLVIAALALAIVPFAGAQEGGEPDYWPTEGWRTSTPEEQGMDSAELAGFIATFSQPQFNLDSLLVIRNGYIVAEAYSAPNQSEVPHHMYSASKSVVSALIGIAIDQGEIKSVDEKMLSFFPEYTPANMDERKAAITVKDLLTMGSGFKCDSFGADPSTDSIPEMEAAENTSYLCLDKPMAYSPGEVQQYCQCNTYLLATILARTTNMDVMEFAKQNLFTPIGITEAHWLATPEGIVQGYAGLQLMSRDMGKIGYLYLNQGQWNGEQIISAQYATDSISDQIATAWPDNTYGYQWWVAPSVNTVSALGHGGQYIIFIPSKDLMVVLTGGLHDTLRIFVHVYPFTYGIAAFTTADSPLPASPEGMQQLEAAINAIASPSAQPTSPLPATAETVSGQSYAMIAPLRLAGFGYTQGPQIQMFDFTFDHVEQAAVTLSAVEGESRTIAIGLDGLYRVSEFWGGDIAARGEWLTENDFRLYLKYVGDCINERLDFSFMPGAATVVEYEYAMGVAAAYAATAVQPE